MTAGLISLNLLLYRSAQRARLLLQVCDHACRYDSEFAHMQRGIRAYFSHGILAPPWTLTEAMLSDETALACVWRPERRAKGADVKALAAPAATAIRAS
jgi:hypothetical protein